MKRYSQNLVKECRVGYRSQVKQGYLGKGNEGYNINQVLVQELEKEFPNSEAQLQSVWVL